MQRIFEAGLALQGALVLTRDPVAMGRIHVAIDELDETLKVLRRLPLRARTHKRLTS
ncbi:MAG: hypothetical protein ACT452_07105 [Microthrixaceae bacterium]